MIPVGQHGTFPHMPRWLSAGQSQACRARGPGYSSASQVLSPYRSARILGSGALAIIGKRLVETVQIVIAVRHIDIECADQAIEIDQVLQGVGVALLL